MPKVVDYPRASFEASMELAQAVYDLGGNCVLQNCADHMKKKVTGAFNANVSAAVKFGLITVAKGKLSTTDLFKNIKHSYTEEEKKKFQCSSFLQPTTFSNIYNKFKNSQSLPVNVLDKILVREFDVEENIAIKVAGYFIEGAKFVNLLNNDNTFNLMQNSFIEGDLVDQTQKNETNRLETQINENLNVEPVEKSNAYVVKISGPGINTTIEIRENDDLIIVEATIAKIKKALVKIE